MILDFTNPAIAAVFGGFCTSVLQIISALILDCRHRKSLVRNLAQIMHDYLIEDIKYYQSLLSDYNKCNEVSFDDTNALLDNSYHMSCIRNDMYLFRNVQLRQDIYAYLFLKNKLLKDIQYVQHQKYTHHSDDNHRNQISNVLSKHIMKVQQQLVTDAESLNKLLEENYKLER